MVVVVTRDVGAVILVLVGGAILRISAGDTYLRYVKESLRPWLLVSGSVLVLLGLLSLVDVWRAGAHPSAMPRGTPPATAEPSSTRTSTGTTDHGAPARRVAPAPAGARAVPRRPARARRLPGRTGAAVGGGTAADSEFPPLPSGRSGAGHPRDYAARAVWDDGRSLDGSTVALTGFVSAARAGGWYLTRLGAHLLRRRRHATKVTVVDAPYDPPADTWVTLTGQWVAGGGSAQRDGDPELQGDGAGHEGARARRTRTSGGSGTPSRQAAQRPKISRVWLTSS